MTIVKAVDGDADSQEFSFTFDGATFTLSDGEQASFEIDDGATHTVVEAETDGWTLASIDCDAEGVGFNSIIANRTLQVQESVDDTEDASATCTFTNEPDPTVTPTPTQTAESTNTPVPTATTGAAANTPVAPTVVPPTSTPPPPSSQVESGTISPPATGSGGLQ